MSGVLRVLLLLSCLVLLAAPALAAQPLKSSLPGGQGAARPAEGKGLPALSAMELQAPATDAERESLGLPPGATTFKLAQVRADFVLLEVLNAFCIHCNAEAPTINDVQQRIEQAGLGARLRLIGIGANNTEFEVKLFRDKYKIAFPLVADERMIAAKALGVWATPTFILVALQGDGAPRVVFTWEGRTAGAEDFFKDIRAKAGL